MDEIRTAINLCKAAWIFKKGHRAVLWRWKARGISQLWLYLLKSLRLWWKHNWQVTLKIMSYFQCHSTASGKTDQLCDCCVGVDGPWLGILWGRGLSGADLGWLEQSVCLRFPWSTYRESAEIWRGQCCPVGFQILPDRKQVLCVKGAQSQPQLVNYDVPQGSIIRPVLFFITVMISTNWGVVISFMFTFYSI